MKNEFQKILKSSSFSDKILNLRETPSLGFSSQGNNLDTNAHDLENCVTLFMLKVPDSMRRAP